MLKPANVWEFISKCAYNGIDRKQWSGPEWFTEEYLNQMKQTSYRVCGSNHRYHKDIFQDALMKFLKHYDKKVKTLPDKDRDRKTYVSYDWKANNRIPVTIDEKKDEYLGRMILADEDQKDVYNMKPDTLEQLFKAQVADTRKDNHRRKQIRLEISFNEEWPLSVTIHLAEGDGEIEGRITEEHKGCRTIGDLRPDKALDAKTRAKLDSFKRNEKAKGKK